jgi:putative NIF3 family GTP cyclohydrolase 1 type 2
MCYIYHHCVRFLIAQDIGINLYRHIDSERYGVKLLYEVSRRNVETKIHRKNENTSN